MNSNEIVNMFFDELRKYNLTNYKTLEKADLSAPNPIIHKAFSSVITRYFIFCEKHDEIPQPRKRILYFQLKLDVLASYFVEYPEGDLASLKDFQSILREHKTVA